MTTFISWISVDSRAPAGLYFASDSRISWGKNKNWDAGRKLFACRNQPDIFGYVGEVVFPSQVLGQLVEAIDGGLLSLSADSSERHSVLVAAIQESFSTKHDAPNHDFSILHATRQSIGRHSTFFMWKADYVANTKSWRDEPVGIRTNYSNLILALGSGERFARMHERVWRESPQGGTSRSIFSAFCDSLASESDALSGGAPQLVGIYPRWNSQSFGISYRGKRYLHGLPLGLPPDSSATIQWRDDLFQRIDSETLDLLEGAQRHVRLGI